MVILIVAFNTLGGALCQVNLKVFSFIDFTHTYTFMYLYACMRDILQMSRSLSFLLWNL